MSQLEILPRFYTGLPAETDELKQKLREEARAQFLQVCDYFSFLFKNLNDIQFPLCFREDLDHFWIMMS